MHDLGGLNWARRGRLRGFPAQLLLRNFGNARTARVTPEHMIQRQARRLAALTEPTRDQLVELLAEDLPNRGPTTVLTAERRRAPLDRLTVTLP